VSRRRNLRAGFLIAQLTAVRFQKVTCHPTPGVVGAALLALPLTAPDGPQRQLKERVQARMRLNIQMNDNRSPPQATQMALVRRE